MQKRIGKVFSIAIISAACFAWPALGAAQSRSSDPTTTSGSTVAPDAPTKRSPAADKNGSSNKKDPSVDRNKDAPSSTGADQTPTK